MFRKKPVIKVLSVMHEIREIETTESVTNYGHIGHTTPAKKITKKVNYTIVLLSKDGELMSREFNGKWNLDDIKQWENI